MNCTHSVKAYSVDLKCKTTQLCFKFICLLKKLDSFIKNALNQLDMANIVVALMVEKLSFNFKKWPK